jgi:hypothetical protein
VIIILYNQEAPRQLAFVKIITIDTLAITSVWRRR